MITEEGRRLAGRARVHQLRVPNLSEIDFARLRAGRLERLQAMMRRHDLPLCLFFNPANVRYATGTDVRLAAVLIAIGILMVYARRFMTRFDAPGPLLQRWLPLASSAVITLFGVVIFVQALRTAGGVGGRF